MNPNRQNNCCGAPVGACSPGRTGGRPPMPGPCRSDARQNSPMPCCSDVRPNPPMPCCSDMTAGGIIIGDGNRDCDRETVLQGLPLAMAYVPWQSYDNLYSVPQALRNGTLFRDLDLEFAGRRCN